MALTCLWDVLCIDSSKHASEQILYKTNEVRSKDGNKISPLNKMGYSSNRCGDKRFDRSESPTERKARIYANQNPTCAKENTPEESKTTFQLDVEIMRLKAEIQKLERLIIMNRPLN